MAREAFFDLGGKADGEHGGGSRLFALRKKPCP